jgi:hypothetical protein
MCDHTRSAERSMRKAPAIWVVSRENPAAHQVFEKGELALIDEEHELAGFGKIGLRRHR